MILPASRLFALLCVLVLIAPGVSRASPILIEFTAQIGAGNNIDSTNVFGEGYGANLRGQVITGSVTINPVSLSAACFGGGACYGDFGTGAITVSFTLNGITATAVSTGTLGYFGNRSGGSVLIGGGIRGGNYVAAGAETADGMAQESIGVLFDAATAFDPDVNGDPQSVVNSLRSIGGGAGLVKGGITYMNPVEHLDATILTIDVPEPATLPLVGAGLLFLAWLRGWRGALAARRVG